MEIKLLPSESEEMLHSALCNGALSNFRGYGIVLDFSEKHYTKARKTLEKNGKKGICYEDVLLQILKNGNPLKFVDEECEGEYSRALTIADVHEKVSTMPLGTISAFLEMEDDADTGDVLLQTLLYGEIIFS